MKWINLIKRRLHDQFGLEKKQVITDGLPTDLVAAKEMFAKDAFQYTILINRFLKS